jgi:hypothetical protein
MRGSCQGNPSKMARKLPQNRGPRSAAVGYGDRGTLLRCLLALLACLERAPGPAGPTATLPKISPLEPIKAPFPRAQRRSLEPGSPAQRFAATQRGRRAQQHWVHHSGEDQSRFPLEGSSEWRDPPLAQLSQRSAPLDFAFESPGSELAGSLEERIQFGDSPNFFLRVEPLLELFERRDVGVGSQAQSKQRRGRRPPKSQLPGSVSRSIDQ